MPLKRTWWGLNIPVATNITFVRRWNPFSDMDGDDDEAEEKNCGVSIEHFFLKQFIFQALYVQYKQQRLS